MRPMTTDLDRRDARPYFLWDEDLSIAELQERLHGDDHQERLRYSPSFSEKLEISMSGASSLLKKWRKRCRWWLDVWDDASIFGNSSSEDGKKMASSPPSRLSPFQSELLRAFFQQEQGFFLTGGAALVGFHLRHRFTDDLDFFTDQEAVFESPHVFETRERPLTEISVGSHESGLAADLLW